MRLREGTDTAELRKKMRQGELDVAMCVLGFETSSHGKFEAVKGWYGMVRRESGI